MRIIAGSRKGHRIEAPKGMATRPTSDFVREAAFNLIGPVDDAVVLDLYAGSGALGLEALSRGAARAVFVDVGREACTTIDANLTKLKLDGTVLCMDAVRALGSDRGTYDLILADPPYDQVDFASLARRAPALLAPHGLLVLQTAARTEPVLEGLTETTSRRYGSARLTLFRL